LAMDQHSVDYPLLEGLRRGLEINKYRSQSIASELGDQAGKGEGIQKSKLYEMLMEKKGYTADQLMQEIEKKRAEYDMLTDEGALVLIANEAGIVLEEPAKISTMKIADLKPGMQDLDIVGRVVRITPPRDFTRRDGSTGYVCSLILSDNTASVRLTLWDQECRLLEDIKENDILRVVGGVCRSGPRGVEIHTGRRARFALNPSASEDPRVQNLGEVVPPTEPPALRKRIAELDEGDANIEIRATIVRFYRVWTYDACPTCGRKVSESRCQICGDVEAVPRAILDVGLDDSSGFIRAKLFGQTAEELLGSTAMEIRRGIEMLLGKGMEPRRASEEYLSRNHSDALGREVVLRGRVAVDEYRGLMLSVESIRDADPVEEAKLILKEVGL